MARLAIIGAGLAGLAAARELYDTRPDLEIVIFEKSRGLGGRAATRRLHGCIFDHGAQYFKTPTAELEQLVRVELPHDELIDIGRPVWVFDAQGRINPGDNRQNAEPKWSYSGGMSSLAKYLAPKLSVQREQRIGRLRYLTGGGYALDDPTGHEVWRADLVLLTPPAPQTAELLEASELDREAQRLVLEQLTRVSYRRCLSMALAYARRPQLPWYALINTDRAHPLVWLACEHDKGPARVPAGQSLYIAQMGPAYSLEHYAVDAVELEQTIDGMVRSLLAGESGRLLWSDLQRWKYALPDGRAELQALNAAETGLYFAGDYTSGQGRVHLALESGWAVARMIGEALEGASLLTH